jgi:hypothetical protein
VLWKPTQSFVLEVFTGQGVSALAVPWSSDALLPERSWSRREESPSAAESTDRLCRIVLRTSATDAWQDISCELMTSELSEPLRIIGGLENALRTTARIERPVTLMIHWTHSFEHAAPPVWPASCDVSWEVMLRDLTKEHTR